MAEYLHKKSYTNFYGLDLKSSDLTRPDGFSSGMKNAQYRKSGAIEKRSGYEAYTASQGGHGLFTYNRFNPTTGTDESSIVSISNILHKLTEQSLVVTYVGSDPTALLSVFYDTATSQYRCQILEGSALVLDQALGLGFDESSPYTVDQLRAAIDALANFTATLSGPTSTPAAFIKTRRDVDLSSSGGPASLIANYWADVNKTVTSPFAGSETNKNSTDFENVTAVNLSNVLYLSNGYDEVQKYDGQTVYRAGLPTPSVPTSALGGVGAVTGTNYFHRITYIQKDNAGNLIEGNYATTAAGLAPAAQSINVTVANVVANTGFNTNCATVNGNQTGVTTITVNNSPHTLQVGDTAYFLDRTGTSYVERSITARTATSITISGANVNVNNGDVISNNLRIGIWRNKTSATTPTLWFLVAEIPNNSLAATQVFNDNTTDANLGATFIEPIKTRETPPKGKYLSAFRNQLIISGVITEPNNVYYSDIDGPEYFPSGSNQFLVESIVGDTVSGIAPNNEVFAIFKKKSIFIASGDIANDNIRIDQLTSDIGCAAHATIQEVRGSLLFLSDRGPYKMTGGQIPEPLGGNRIEPVFDQQGVDSTLILQTKRAIGFNDREKEKYLLYIPTETLSGSNRYANTFSPIYAYDYTRDAFLQWSNMNMAGGIAALNGELYFSERRQSAFTAAVEHILYRRHNLNDAYDYQDNNSPIDFMYKSHWEALGEPSVLKRFLRIRIFANEELANNALNLTVKSEINYIPDSTHTELTFAFSTTGYGVSAYGTSAYGDPLEPTLKSRLRPGRIRSERILFENARNQENVIITGWEEEIAAPFRPAMKV